MARNEERREPGKQSRIAGELDELDELGAFVILTHPDVRLEVYVQREMVSQWLRVERMRARTAGSNRTHREISTALLRFHRWVASINESTPRARRLNAQGVRLWINGGLVAAYCVDDSIAFLPSSSGAPLRPARKRRPKPKR